MEKAFKKFDKIDIIKDKITFRDDSRIVEIFEMTVAGDRNRLENAEARMAAAEQQHNARKSQVDSANNRLKALEDELLRVKKTCDELEKGVVVSCSNNSQDVEEKKSSIVMLKNNLKTYQDLTGVHFCFNSPQEVVAGCVVVKGDTTPQSKMQTFVLDKRSPHLQEDIWNKVQEIASDKSDLSSIYENY